MDPDPLKLRLLIDVETSDDVSSQDCTVTKRADIRSDAMTEIRCMMGIFGMLQWQSSDNWRPVKPETVFTFLNDQLTAASM